MRFARLHAPWADARVRQATRTLIRPWPLALLVLLTALGTRVWHIAYRSIWMDEDAQVGRALGGLHGMVARAATQQQPPIDYYLQYLGLQAFGTTPLGARLHAAILGSLTVLVVYLLLRRMFGIGVPLLIGTLATLLHPVLLFYSQEARPIACGVCFASLLLLCLHGFMLGRRSRLGRALWGTALWASCTLFLLSVGFQPMVFLATTCIALLPGVRFRELRLRVALAWLLVGAGFLAAFPILDVAIERGTPLLRRLSLDERLADWLREASKSTPEVWTDKLDQLLAPLWPLAIVVAALGTLGWLSEVRQARASVASGAPTSPAPSSPEAAQRRDQRRVLGFSLLFVACYPWLFDTTFHALIDYKIKVRYYATLTPVLMVALASLTHFAMAYGRRVVAASGRGKRAAWLGVVGVLAATLVVQVSATAHAYQKKHRDWAALYALFKRAHEPGVAYMVHLVEPKVRRPNYYSQRFYYNDTHPRLVALRKQDDIERDCRRSGGVLDREHVYLVVRYDWKKLARVSKRVTRELAGAKFHRFYGTSVLELSAPRGESRAMLERSFEALVEHLGRSEDNYRAYVILASLELCNGHVDEARRTVKALKKLGSRDLRTTVKKLQKRVRAAAKRGHQRKRKHARGRRR